MQPCYDWQQAWGHHGLRTPHTPARALATPHTPALALATPGAVGNLWTPGHTPGDVDFASRVWLERERRRQADAWGAWGATSNAAAAAHQTPGSFNFYAVPCHPAYCSHNRDETRPPAPFTGTFTPGPGGALGLTTTPAPAPPTTFHVTPTPRRHSAPLPFTPTPRHHNALLPFTHSVPAIPPLPAVAPPPYTPWPMPGPLPTRRHRRKRRGEKVGITREDFPGPPSLPVEFRANWKQDTKNRTPCGKFRSWIGA